MLEMNFQPGEEGFLSAWKIDSVRPIKLAHLLPRNVKESNPWSKFNNDIHSDQIRLWSESYPDLIHHYNALANFIGDAYRLKDPGYWLSSFISKKLLFGENYNDFILYPSISTDEHYANMAFHPNFVDHHMKLYRVFQFRIEKIVQNTLAFSFGLVGELQNGHMKWRRKNIYDREVLDKFNRFTGDKNQ